MVKIGVLSNFLCNYLYKMKKIILIFSMCLMGIMSFASYNEFLPSTNIQTQSNQLQPTSNATNFTVNLTKGEIGNVQTIWLSNTNAYISFTGTNTPDTSRTVIFEGQTNTINSQLAFNCLGYHTNAQYSTLVSNGYSAIFNFYNLDSSGTNIMISDGGRWH